MQAFAKSFDVDNIEWHHIKGEPEDASPHLETGRPEGAVMMLSLQTDTGVLFEAFDPDFNKLFDFTIGDMVERWENR